jgi:hypothetical protein
LLLEGLDSPFLFFQLPHEFHCFFLLAFGFRLPVTALVCLLLATGLFRLFSSSPLFRFHSLATFSVPFLAFEFFFPAESFRRLFANEVVE